MLRLAAERQARGWTLEELQKRTLINRANLSRLERGLIPAYPHWRRRLARAFRVPGDALFEEVVENEHAVTA